MLKISTQARPLTCRNASGMIKLIQIVVFGRQADCVNVFFKLKILINVEQGKVVVNLKKIFSCNEFDVKLWIF